MSDDVRPHGLRDPPRFGLSFPFVARSATRPCPGWIGPPERRALRQDATAGQRTRDIRTDGAPHGSIFDRCTSSGRRGRTERALHRHRASANAARQAGDARELPRPHRVAAGRRRSRRPICCAALADGQVRITYSGPLDLPAREPEARAHRHRLQRLCQAAACCPTSSR